MMRRILIAYSVEFANAIRLRTTYFGPALVVATILAASFVHPIANDRGADYAFIAYVIPMSLDLLGVAMLLLYCSTLVSSDLGSGAIRTILVKPIRRREYLLAKLLMGITYASVLVAFGTLTAWTTAFFLGDLTGVHYGDEVIYTNAEMLQSFGIALLLGLVPLYTTVAYALMISTFTRSNLTAVVASIGGLALIDFIKMPLRAQDYLFSSYLEAPWVVFSDHCNALSTPWLETAQQTIAISFVWAAMFVTVGLWVLSRRNLAT